MSHKEISKNYKKYQMKIYKITIKCLANLKIWRPKLNSIKNNQTAFKIPLTMGPARS